MEPSESPILPQWISIFSNTYLLGFSLFLAIFIICLMFFVLRGRSCHDWYLTVFTTLALFNLLMLAPFIQSSRLAPGEETEQFIDIDRPWLLIVTFGFAAFILTASTTSVEYIIEFMKPSWKDKSWMTVLRIFTTFTSLTLPVVDVLLEWMNEEASTHCLENVCRWFLSRKDACLCILLLLWSLAVSLTLICANLDYCLLLPEHFQMWRNNRKCLPPPVSAQLSASEIEYRIQLRLAREREDNRWRERFDDQITRMRQQCDRGGARREQELATLAAPHITRRSSHVQPRVQSSSRDRRSASLVPSAPPYTTIDTAPIPPYPESTPYPLSSVGHP